MARTKGTAIFAVNFEPTGQSPLDARTVVALKSDLTTAATYADNNIYNGMVVSVLEDNTLWMLINMNDITNPSSWKQLDADAISDVKDDLATAQEDIIELQAGLTAAEVAIADLQSGLSGAQTDIATISGTVDTISDEVNEKVESVSGTGAISVTTGTTPIVSLGLDNSGNVQFTQSESGLKASVEIPSATVTGVKNDDKVLSLSGTELSATIGLKYTSSGGTHTIDLTGVEGQVIASINAADFIKDGMVSEVSFNPGTKKLTITFNTDAGKEPVEVDLTSLVDTYTAGNGINISGNVVSVKLDESTESFLSVSENGMKLSGVQEAIDSKVSKEEGKGLSTEDFTSALKAKLEGIESGAEVNIIESISVNGVSATVDEKSASVSIDSKDILIPEDSALTGNTGDTIDEVLAQIRNDLNSAISGGLTSVQAGNGINVTDISDNSQTISIKLSEADGNLASINENGLFVAMYYDGDDVEEA